MRSIFGRILSHLLCFRKLFLLFLLVQFVPEATGQSSTESPLYFAQIADGGGYSTSVILLNRSLSSVEGNLRFWTPEGEARELTIGNIKGSLFYPEIAGEGVALLSTSNSGLEALAGWAAFVGAERVSGLVLFELRAGEKLTSIVSVLGSPGGRQFLLPVELGDQRNTGLAIANVRNASTLVTVNLRSEDGLSAGEPRQLEFGPLAQRARFITELFPEVAAWKSFKGTLEIYSPDGPVAVTGLVVDSGLLSALPVFCLDSDRSDPKETGVAVRQAGKE